VERRIAGGGFEFGGTQDLCAPPPTLTHTFFGHFLFQKSALGAPEQHMSHSQAFIPKSLQRALLAAPSRCVFILCPCFYKALQQV